VHPLLIGASTIRTHPYNLDQLISEDGTVMIELPILSVEEGTINYSGSQSVGWECRAPLKLCRGSAVS